MCPLRADSSAGGDGATRPTRSEHPEPDALVRPMLSAAPLQNDPVPVGVLAQGAVATALVRRLLSSPHTKGGPSSKGLPRAQSLL